MAAPIVTAIAASAQEIGGEDHQAVLKIVIAILFKRPDGLLLTLFHIRPKTLGFPQLQVSVIRSWQRPTSRPFLKIR